MSHIKRSGFGIGQKGVAYCCAYRYPAVIMMEIAYGHPVQTTNDAFISFADKTLKELVELGSVVSTVIDFFPFCK